MSSPLIIESYCKSKDKNKLIVKLQLVIGNAGITLDMAISQMTIWCIWSAPLIMSNDLRTIAHEFRAVLLNRDVIAIDQDPLGRMGRLVANVRF